MLRRAEGGRLEGKEATFREQQGERGRSSVKLHFLSFHARLGGGPWALAARGRFGKVGMDEPNGRES